MLWFFVFPSLLFMGWASYKFVGGVLNPKPRDAFSKLAEVQSAPSAGDRWQAAYGLAQALQQMSRDGELARLAPEKKEQLYSTLEDVLKNHSSDARLRKYLLLTLGQMSDVRALPALEANLNDPVPEVRFYAAWGLIDILTKHPEAVTPKHLTVAQSWLMDPDIDFRKVASTFLAQQKDPQYRTDVAKLLSDANLEVRWNAAVALASVGDPRANATLNEIFDLQTLRSADIHSSDDLTRIVSAAYSAAKKLNDREILAKAEQLKAKVDVSTPEGRAIHAAIR